MSGIHGQHLGFGIVSGFTVTDPDDLVAEARHAEALGFDTFALSDHLHGVRPSWEPWTALTWVAAATERIHVATDVLGLPYRSPAVLAKTAETLDRLSRGRLVLGLGSGGHDAEFSAFGLRVRSPGQQVAALGEAVRVIRGLWNQDALTMDGEHFQVTQARITPRPAHRIPVWLGTYGPRALALTGAVADGWLPSMQRMDLPQARAMRTRVRAAAEAAGRDPDSITCACNVQVLFDDTRAPTGRLVTGGSQAIAEQLLAVVRAGFTFPQLFGLGEADARERFATEVIPLVRREFARV
ncbi:LLM class flavin-dependent oxidoreductase [Streptomyces sp. NBC_01477]|uniref:LLM class flavin-dependent oxidoreductase n=1 Tax=Streptomyces sp. NBC_01477 TaxID=2976015 RepID=UPI002E2FD642|nr:LLM class flavin-dependent oxidoreductase [Streptomyces sp. NBC_01477]